jgi:hypothetical protein
MDISSLLESKNLNQSFAAKPLVTKWEKYRIVRRS